MAVLVVWTDAARVAALLGPTAPADDARLADCAAAANAWLSKARAAAGYVESDTPTLTDPDCVEAATLYAASEYRQRATVDGYASFDDQAVPIPASTFARCKSLAGIPRAVVY